MALEQRLLPVGLVLLLVSSGCGTSNDTAKPGADGGIGYHVTIRGTSYGIPHILADDLPSLDAGLGYVGARDYGCILLDQIVRVRSERAKFFGPGDKNANIDSDFGMLALSIHDSAKRRLPSLDSTVRGMIDGYVAGFNYYLAHEKLSAECDGKDWARPLTAEDLFAYYYWLAQLASDDPLFAAVATAQPPGVAQAAQALSAPQSLPDLAHSSLGSNGWAIGADKSASGHGMLLANPHFPWEGNRRFYENQLTVPGVMNVYGASLVGSPVVNIGFNDHVGWTHTVTTAHHFTLYKLTLAAGDPTSYLYDGTPRAMTSTDFSIEVLGTDGNTTTETRTMYRSHYGPMITISQLGGWTTATGFTFRNANEDNFALGDQWLRMDEAQSLDDLRAVNEDVQGIPWVNTMAVDAGGTALYMDASRTPNLSDAALAAYNAALANDVITQAVNSQGGTLLDGSNSTFEWQDAGGKAPGIVPFSRSPQLQRRDFVANANDSYWLTNPASPLTGYSVLFGDERTPRTPRTRMNLLMLTEATTDGFSGTDGKFTFDELSQVEFGDRASIAEVLLNQVLARCAGATSVTVDGASVDVKTPCGVLAAWDRRLHLDSVGAVLWRELLASSTASLFADAFNPDDPVHTPKTLVAAPATGDDPVLVALAKGVKILESAGFDIGVTIGVAQHTKKGSEVIPIHGGTNPEGAFNVVGYNADSGTLLPSMQQGPVLSAQSGLTGDGYLVNVGSSFMMVLEFQDGGPHAQAVLSYSESDDPASPNFADQTHLFSQSKYRPVLFTEAEIAADPNLAVTELSIP